MSDTKQYKVGDIITFKKAVKLEIVGCDKQANDENSCKPCFFDGNGCSYTNFTEHGLPFCFLPMSGYPTITFEQKLNLNLLTAINRA